MIISRAPFRISFFGGGTDYPVWYREHGGMVISGTINKYCFITLRYLPPFFDYKFRVRYYVREETRTVAEIEHPSVRECLRYLEVGDGVDLVHHADLPAQSGLGSSSTFTVALLHAIHALKHEMPTKYQLAMEAIHIEQEKIGEYVGSQDQAAAAFGGLNRIEFAMPREVLVQPLILPQERLESLQMHLMLFFTGFSRSASDIAKEQVRLTPSKTQELRALGELTVEAESVLLSRDTALEEWGRLFREQWKIKRSLTPLVSNGAIDAIYERGLQAGALGGKLLGAGGGGFMLFCIRPEHQIHLKEELSDLLHVPFLFEFSGSQIIYFAHHS